MNSKMNRSFGELFKNPILPQFPRRSSTKEEESVCEKQMMDQRLASRLSTPAGRKRSSRKSTNRSNKKDIPTDLGSNSCQDTDVTSTSVSWDSSSTIGQEVTGAVGQPGIDVAYKMKQTQVKDDSFDDLEQKVQGKGEHATSIHATSPGSLSKDRHPKSESENKSFFRRTKAEGKDTLLEEVIEIKTSSPKEKRRSTRRSTKPTCGNSGKRGSYQREKSDLSVSNHSPSSKSRRNMSTSNSGNPSRRKTSSRRAASLAVAHHDSPASPVPPARQDPWTCKCGFVLEDSYSFCGMCGCKKHWTCDRCQFKDNMSCFVFCGNCGISREAAADSESDKESLEDPFLDLTTSPPKLLTMYESAQDQH